MNLPALEMTLTPCTSKIIINPVQFNWPQNLTLLQKTHIGTHSNLYLKIYLLELGVDMIRFTTQGTFYLLGMREVMNRYGKNHSN